MIGTQFNYYDLSQITEVENVVVTDNAPVILACFGADKGTEDMFDLSGNDFISMFGAPSFKNYGQVSIQAREVIDAGGRIVGKRVVADDAMLANTIISAKMYQTSTQKTNANGDLLYYTNGSLTETTEAESAEGGPNAAIMVNTAHVYYEASTATNVKTVDGIIEKMKTMTDDTGVQDEETGFTTFTYPLFTVYDNGRGVSAKRFRIYPENKLSKNLTYMYYTLNVIEDGSATDSTMFTMIPDIVSNGACIDMNSVSSSNLKMVNAQMDESNMDLFVKRLSLLSDIDIDDLVENDVIFGTNRKGTPFASIVVDTLDYVDLTLSGGIALESGNNGSFGNSPASDTSTVSDTTIKALYYSKIKEFYDGTFTPDIYDLDSYQIDFCFDANLPLDIKESIVTLAEYRKDFMFFRDYGLGCTSYDSIANFNSTVTKSTWTTDYCQAYDVVDMYSKKQITVSIMHAIAPMITVNAVNSSITTPFAGQRYGAVISEIIDGTLNYKPRITPSVNEKDELEDIRVNFGTYYRNTFVLETLYTSQEAYSQLSFSNNVMALQQVIKAMRTTFPAIRYAYITSSDDLNAYTSQINNMLSSYSSNFAELSFQYVGDSIYIANKIYKGAISFRFNDFVQAEIIDAYALPTA